MRSEQSIRQRLESFHGTEEYYKHRKAAVLTGLMMMAGIALEQLTPIGDEPVLPDVPAVVVVDLEVQPIAD